MPTLKNKKICEDVPPQLDLGPRPSFDSAHLDVPSDQFIPVSPAQNGVKMINEPPKALGKAAAIVLTATGSIVLPYWAMALGGGGEGGEGGGCGGCGGGNGNGTQE